MVALSAFTTVSEDAHNVLRHVAGQRVKGATGVEQQGSFKWE